MALVLADRVRETTTTTGTGTVTLAGVVTGFQSFSVVGNGNTTYYTIAGQGTSEWEVGIGTYTSSGTTLSRDTVLASSNSGSLVNFSAGTKDVFVTYPAGKSVYEDAGGAVTLPDNLTATGNIVGGIGSAAGNYVFNSYTSPATWTKPTNLKAIKVTVVGAGGNGGTVAATPTLSSGGGRGGGAGGGSIYYAPAPTIPGPVSVTAGPGTNSFGPFASATAGSAGSGPSAGAGGAGSGGTINLTGGSGSVAAGTTNNGGVGANACFGLGSGAAQKAPAGPGAVVPGSAAIGYGSGGGGGSKVNATAAAPGGAGAPGIVIVEEFY